MDALTKAGSLETDPAKRAEIYKKIQQITTGEVSQIPLYYPPYTVAYSQKLSGLELSPMLQWTLEDAVIQN